MSLFEVVFPSTDTPRGVRSPGPPFWMAFLIALCAFGLLHLKQGRTDTRSAWRFGLYGSTIAAATTLLVPMSEPMLNFYAPLSAGATAALMYLAIEPWTRRLWPHVMITWARVLSGRWRDPVVGRDVLITVACVALNYALQRVVLFVAVQNGAVPHFVNSPGHFGLQLDSLANSRVMAANLVVPFFYGLTVGMGLFLTLFILKTLVRRTWIAAGLALVLWLLGNADVFSHWMDTLQWSLEFVFLLFLTLRFGVFASALFSCLSMLIDWSLFTSDFGAWYGRPSLAATLILGGLTIVAFRVSIGRRPMLGSWTLS